jgi:hypothetical protein
MGSGGTRALWPANPAIHGIFPSLTFRFLGGRYTVKLAMCPFTMRRCAGDMWVSPLSIFADAKPLKVKKGR